MKTVFPYFDFIKTVATPALTNGQYNFLLIEHWMATLLYAGLCILVVANIWKILIRQGKWSTVPLTLFYIFSFLAIYAKLVIIILYADLAKRWFWILLQFQPFLKLEVGVV